MNNNVGNGAWNAGANNYFMGAANANGTGAANNGANPMANFNATPNFSSNPMAAAMLAGSLGNAGGNPNVSELSDLLVQNGQAGVNNNPMISNFDLQ